jgi:hypothetical protein
VLSSSPQIRHIPAYTSALKVISRPTMSSTMEKLRIQLSMNRCISLLSVNAPCQRAVPQGRLDRRKNRQLVRQRRKKFHPRSINDLVATTPILQRVPCSVTNTRCLRSLGKIISHARSQAFGTLTFNGRPLPPSLLLTPSGSDVTSQHAAELDSALAAGGMAQNGGVLCD